MASKNNQQDSIFTKIIKREIPGDFIYEDDKAIVIKDINPQAPVHLLAIPKKQIISVSDIEIDDIEVIKTVTAQMNLDENGYRIIINSGKHACQEVPHLHLHILGGRQLRPFIV